MWLLDHFPTLGIAMLLIVGYIKGIEPITARQTAETGARILALKSMSDAMDVLTRTTEKLETAADKIVVLVGALSVEVGRHDERITSVERRLQERTSRR